MIFVFRNIRYAIGLILILIISCSIAAQAPKFGNDFLNIGVGARAQAMGGAAAAFSNNVQAGYWNPAILSGLDVPFQVSAMHAEIFAGITKYDYLSIGKKLNEQNNAFGSISIIRMGIDDIPNTLFLRDQSGNIDYGAIKSFSVVDYATFLSYARSIFNDDNLRLGISTKIIYRQIGSFARDWGFGFDVGLQIERNDYYWGIMLKDATSTFNAWSFNFAPEEKAVLIATGNAIPVNSVESTLPALTLAGARKIRTSAKSSLLVELDLAISTNGRKASLISQRNFDLDPRLGAEFSYSNLFYLRAGVSNFQRLTDAIDQTRLDFQPTAGLGLHLGRLQLDYALTDIGNVSVLEYSHVFTLTLDFVAGPRERK